MAKPEQGKPRKARKGKVEDHFIDKDVKDYVFQRFNADKIPQVMVAESQAINLMTVKILRAVLIELHYLRMSFCRHNEGYCGVPPCQEPPPAEPKAVSPFGDD